MAPLVDNYKSGGEDGFLESFADMGSINKGGKL